MDDLCINYKRQFDTLYDGINKVSAEELRDHLDHHPGGTGDMLKSVYDTDDDGVVDYAEFALNVGLFEMDSQGDLMPVEGTTIDYYFELDSNFDIMPK